MILLERMICTECERKKLLPAGLKTRFRAPGKNDVAQCAFCHQVRYCKCWRIEIGGKVG